MKSPMKRADRDKDGAKEAPTFVYVAICEKRVKIGVAGDVALRMRQLRNGSGLQVDELCSRLFSTRLSAEAVEEKLHAKFKTQRLHGEWFDIVPTRALEALERATDPELHIADWFQGMPPEIAQAGPIERWRWNADNGIRSLKLLVQLYGRRDGKARYLAQVPSPGQWPRKRAA